MQGMSSQRRAGVSMEVLRSCMKVALDGPRTDEFAPLRGELTPLCKLAQNCYVKIFGGRKYSKNRGDAAWGSGRKGEQREGSMAQALAQRWTDLRQPCPAEPLDLAAAAVVENAMKARLTEAQEKCIEGAGERTDEKMRQLVDDAAPHSEVCGWSPHAHA